MNWDSDSAHIAPQVVYRITANSSNEVVTPKNYNLKWLGREVCNSHFFCLSLDGNVCGDYGINLNQVDTNKEVVGTTRVCFENVAYESELLPNEKSQIELWVAAPKPTLEFTCLFWCTTEGAIPPAKPDPEVTSDLVDKLVSGKLAA